MPHGERLSRQDAQRRTLVQPQQHSGVTLVALFTPHTDDDAPLTPHAEYGRAVTVASRAWKTPEEIDQFVEVRLARQRRLTDENAMSLWAVLAEGTLRQHVGGPSVMRAQLEHLVTMAELPNITVQVLPFSRGAHSGMFGPYLLLSFPQVTSLDLVLTETPTGNIWMEREPEVAYYRTLFDDARTTALPPEESIALIRRTAKGYRP